MNNLPDKRWFRPDEVARYLEQPVRTIYRWLDKDMISHLHLGRKTLIPRTELERILREGIGKTCT